MSLYKTFTSELAPSIKKELKISNTMAVPRVRMVKVQVGIGSLLKNTKDFSDVADNLAKITGQKPVVVKAKQAVSNFKLRQGMPVSIEVTLRGKRALDFLDRLVNIALPRVRDFRGISARAFDGKGNYSLGLKEATVFPEINPDNVQNVHGLQITVVTTSQNDEEGRTLLEKMGFPFKKETPKKTAEEKAEEKLEAKQEAIAEETEENEEEPKQTDEAPETQESENESEPDSESSEPEQQTMDLDDNESNKS